MAQLLKLDGKELCCRALGATGSPANAGLPADPSPSRSAEGAETTAAGGPEGAKRERD